MKFYKEEDWEEFYKYMLIESMINKNRQIKKFKLKEQWQSNGKVKSLSYKKYIRN